MDKRLPMVGNISRAVDDTTYKPVKLKCPQLPIDFRVLGALRRWFRLGEYGMTTKGPPGRRADVAPGTGDRGH